MSTHGDVCRERCVHTEAPAEPLPGCSAYGDECKVQFSRDYQSSIPLFHQVFTVPLRPYDIEVPAEGRKMFMAWVITAGGGVPCAEIKAPFLCLVDKV